MTITQRQREILQHALGWPRCYRNHFVTYPESDDFADCEALVDAGLMSSRRMADVPCTVYRVTATGIEEAGK